MNSEALQLTPDQLEALGHARRLAAAGIPLFLADPDPSEDVGFKLPGKWQNTAPDPTVVDRWRPGMALCAVMGRGVDLLDVDLRHGGDLDALGQVPVSYGVASTPSGGFHSFVAPLGVGSRDNVHPGLDVKAGVPSVGGGAGDGHGFAFLAPTVRISKVTGEPAPYTWVMPPDVERLTAVWADPALDTSGAVLAGRVRELRAASGAGMRPGGGPSWWQDFINAKEPQSLSAANQAIDEKLAEVTGWKADSGGGFRNVLLRAALTLGGYVGGGFLDDVAARERLAEAVSAAWGSPDDDDLLWIEQGITDGQQKPFYVYSPEDEQRYGEAAQTVVVAQHEKWSPYRSIGLEPFDPHYCATDQDHAEAVALRMAPILLYAPDAAVWLKQDRGAWSVSKADLTGWSIATLARLMPLGDPDLPANKADYTAANWQAVRRKRYMNAATTAPIAKKLRDLVPGGDHPATVLMTDLDTEPEVLWAGGLPWDLRASGEVPTLVETSAINRFSPHLHNTDYMPARMDTPFWDRFVSAVWPDPEVRTWALRVLSIALTGYPDAALPVLYGPPRSGKTALVSLLVDMLGSYGIAADPRLLSGADTAHASIIYALKGSRLAFIDEGPRRGHLAAERLKQLTGGGKLTGNAMRQDPITFAPTHTLVMTTNDEPPITDPALRARIRVIPCDAEETAVRLARQAITPAVWRAEAPGVLAAMMREAAGWLADRDSASQAAAPSTLRGLVADMEAGQNPVVEWVEFNTIPAHPGTAARQLYRQFVGWFEAQPVYRRQSPPTETAFGRRLTELGYPALEGQGPEKKLRYRPLTVMGGGPGSVPWEPVHPQGAVDNSVQSTTIAEGSPTDGRGSAATPSEAESPRSGGVSSSSSDSSDSSSCSTTTPNTSLLHIGDTGPTYIQGNRGYTLSVGTHGEDTPNHSASPAETPNPGGCPETPGNPRPSEGSGSGRVADTSVHPHAPLSGLGDSKSSSIGHTPSRKVTKARLTPEEKAERAARAKAAKVAEREATRLAAVRAAGGEVLALPAVADREGHVLSCTPEQAAAVVRTALARSGALTVDVETSGYPVGHEHYELRTVQLGDATAAVVLHPVEHGDLVRELLAEAPVLHAHSATADLVPLAHAGLIDIESGWDRMFDTVIPAKNADPQSTGSDPGLKQLAGAVLGAQSVAPAAEEARKALFKAGKWLEKTEIETPPERSGWAQVDSESEVMIRYAASDVLDTAALAARLPRLEPALLERERTAQRMTARVTHRGLRLDAAHIAEMSARHTAAMAEAAARSRVFGIENPGSDQQVAQKALQLGASLPKTKTGRPSVAAGILDPLRAAPGPLGEFVGAVLDYRHNETVMGLFLDPYRLLVERGDGRARPTIYTLGTNTGRMSAVRPNIQQLSKVGGVRACITADPGHVLISADFSGVELRVAAALSGDLVLTEFLANGRDLHAEIARQVWGPEATKGDRYAAKRIVFGRLYGGGVPTLATQAGVSESIAGSAVDTLDAMLPQLAEWSRRVREAVKAGATQFKAYSGRVIHLPKEFPHKAPNYCIQGSARELLVDALVKWQDTRWGNATLFPVHDELVVMVPEAEAEDATAELVRCMETELFGIQIVAEPSAPSLAWADSV